MANPTSPLRFEDREQAENQKYYLTTAIAYLNGAPHIGHTYEAVLADVMCRYQRLSGRKVYFLTGSDEHGQKVASAAARQKITPQEHCDSIVKLFLDMNKKYLISQDKFIRTTDERHHRCAQWAWKRAEANGDIYHNTYSGWYNVREETFVTQRDAEANNFKDPETGVPYEHNEEQCYFFRLSKYSDRILDLLKSSDFAFPSIRKNEIVSRLERSPLEDLCVSRKTLKWGIPVPDHEEQVMYVWFDALSNYITGVEADDPSSELSSFWPPDDEIIGKDIIWFHCVIWPAMIMSMGLPMPKRIPGHGFISAADGMKMSKSFGNTMDPMELVEVYSAETIRFWLIRETRFGMDMRFSTDAVVDCHNADLADVFGNLVHRVTSLCVKNCNGAIPDVDCSSRTDKPVDFAGMYTQIEQLVQTSWGLSDMLDLTVNATKDINKFLTVTAPWAIKNDATLKATVIKTALEALYIVSHFFMPVLPEACAEVFRRLGTPAKSLAQVSPNYDNLKPGVPVTTGEILYKKLLTTTTPSS